MLTEIGNSKARLKCGDLPVLIRKENKLVDLGRRDFPSLLLCLIPNVVAMNAWGEKRTLLLSAGKLKWSNASV